MTVVIPCYNCGRYQPLAVASALDQFDVDTDALIVDDASTGGSGSVARDLARTADRVRAILCENNRGRIATHNKGLAQATGELVVLLSGDDALAPGALARAIEKVRRRFPVRPATGEQLYASARRALAKAAVTYGGPRITSSGRSSSPLRNTSRFADRVWPEARRWRKCRGISECPAAGSPMNHHPLARLGRSAVMDVTSRARSHRWRWSCI